MKLKIFGSGCSKCTLLAEHTETAANELGIGYELEKVTDMNQIINAGVMRTPALSVDDQIVVEGNVPSAGELKQYLS